MSSMSSSSFSASSKPSKTVSSRPQVPQPQTPSIAILLKTRSLPTDAYETYFSAQSSKLASSSTPNPSSNPFSTSSPSSSSPPLQTNPIFVPVLTHSFSNSSRTQLATLLSNSTPLSSYGGLIITSQRAVEALAATLTDLRQTSPSTITRLRAEFCRPLYTVGPATSRAVQALANEYFPRCSIEGRETGCGENLAAYILQNYAGGWSEEETGKSSLTPLSSSSSLSNKAADYNHNQKSPTVAQSDDLDAASSIPQPNSSTTDDDRSRQRKPLLFLVGETRRDIIPTKLASPTLPAHTRIQVDGLIVYETTVKDSFAQDFAAVLAQTSTCTSTGTSVTTAEAKAPPRWIIVFSPTGCAVMLRVLSWLDESTGKVKSNQKDKPISTPRSETDANSKFTPREETAQNDEPSGHHRETESANEFKNLDEERESETERTIFVASIGPTTRDYLLREFGFCVDVCAETPSPEGVRRGIECFMKERREGRGKVEG